MQAETDRLRNLDFLSPLSLSLHHLTPKLFQSLSSHPLLTITLFFCKKMLFRDGVNVWPLMTSVTLVCDKGR